MSIFNCTVTKLKENLQKMNFSPATVHSIYIAFQLSCQCTYAKKKKKKSRQWIFYILEALFCSHRKAVEGRKCFKKETTLESTFLFWKNVGNILSGVLWKYLTVAHLFSALAPKRKVLFVLFCLVCSLFGKCPDTKWIIIKRADGRYQSRQIGSN